MYEAKVILVLLVKHVYIGIVKYKRKQFCLATNRQVSNYSFIILLMIVGKCYS